MSITASEMGKRSAELLTPEQRTERARKAGLASWKRLSKAQRTARAKRAAQRRKGVL